MTQPCNQHTIMPYTFCPGCRANRITAFESQLEEAVLDLLPSAMRLVLKTKIRRIVKLIAEAVR